MTQAQLNLLDYRIPDPPHRGGSTQVEAAKRIRKVAGAMERKVLDALEVYGPMTNDELCERTGIGLATMCARVWTLRVKLGLVKDSGARRPSHSGRMAIVWEKIPNPSERR